MKESSGRHHELLRLISGPALLLSRLACIPWSTKKLLLTIGADGPKNNESSPPAVKLAKFGISIGSSSGSALDIAFPISGREDGSGLHFVHSVKNPELAGGPARLGSLKNISSSWLESRVRLGAGEEIVEEFKLLEFSAFSYKYRECFESGESVIRERTESGGTKIRDRPLDTVLVELN